MNKPSTLPGVEVDFGVIALWEVPRESLVRTMELGALYVYLEATAISDVQQEGLECANNQVQRLRNEKSAKGSTHSICMEK